MLVPLHTNPTSGPAASALSGTAAALVTTMMQEEPVLEAALAAKEAGSTRFSMGTAWRGPEQVGSRQFKRILTMVEKIRGMGLESSLGVLRGDPRPGRGVGGPVEPASHAVHAARAPRERARQRPRTCEGDPHGEQHPA